MTITEFVEVLSEIEKFFGKELTDFESKKWHEELKEISKERFRQLARECYRNNKFMPKLADIIDYNKSVPRLQKRDYREKENCKICGNTGFVSYTKLNKDEGIEYFYVAKCKCTNGTKLGKSIPIIDEVKVVV